MGAHQSTLVTLAVVGESRRGDEAGVPVRGDKLGRYVVLEGQDRPRNVVARFPSVEDAVACYNSPRYQEALEFAKAASERDLMVVEEV